jgi:hypothetical protein
VSLEKGKHKGGVGVKVTSTSQFPHKPQELEIRNDEHFKGIHKKRVIYRKDLFRKTG